MIIITNGHLVDPKTAFDDRCDIIIKDGIIADILPAGEAVKNMPEASKDLRLIDASGLYVFPGFIDLHVHFREPGFEYKETIATGSRAAAKGGFTTVCPMPNTKPVIDSPEMVRWIVEKAKTDSVVHIVPVGSVTKGQLGEEVTDIEGMVKEGALAISEDGKSVMNSKVYEEAMKLAVKTDIAVLAHCEDKNLVGRGAANAGACADRLKVDGITNQVEDIIAARDILLAKQTGARLHLCHCSTKDSVMMVRLAKEDGLDVTAEVCPHHFTLCTDDIKEDDANFKMNPPLREREDMLALREGLVSGIMETIATDHAPHSAQEKSRGFAGSPFGITGLETAFALSYTELVKKDGMSLTDLIKAMSLNPAEVLKIDKGCIAKGKAADICVAGLDEAYRIDIEGSASKGKNSPFDGREVYGKIVMTIVDGKVVYTT